MELLSGDEEIYVNSFVFSRKQIGFAREQTNNA